MGVTAKRRMGVTAKEKFYPHRDLRNSPFGASRPFQSVRSYSIGVCLHTLVLFFSNAKCLAAYKYLTMHVGCFNF